MQLLKHHWLQSRTSTRYTRPDLLGRYHNRNGGTKTGEQYAQQLRSRELNPQDIRYQDALAVQEDYFPMPALKEVSYGL
jgi:hypothetical protein